MTTPPKHEPQWIRTDDDQGIVRIGLSWHERQPGVGKFFAALAALMIPPTLFFLAGGLLGWGTGGLLFLICLGAGAGLFWLGVTLGGPMVPRALIFERGGRMLIPSGMPRLEHLSQVGGSHASIISIETHLVRKYGDPRDDYYSVRMISSQGDVIVLSHNLLETEAMTIAVRLSNALQTLRGDEGEAEARAA